MSRIDLHIASREQAEAVWPAVRAAHLFPDRTIYLRERDEAPWRVRVDERQRAVVLERWRPHLDIMAIQGLWAPGRDIPGVIDGVRAVARAQGFARLLSPLVAEEMARPYRAAGLEPCATIVALRIAGRAAQRCEARPPRDVRIRTATAADAEALAGADATCFGPFWAYGRDRFARVRPAERIAVAESDTGIIGYTLCTVERGNGTLGRLGVVPDARQRGIGASLLCESLRYMERTGAGTINLCTQIENAASRSLYARFGLRELPGRLQFLVGEV